MKSRTKAKPAKPAATPRVWKPIWINGPLSNVANPKHPKRPTLAEMIVRCDHFEARARAAEERYAATLEGRLEKAVDLLDTLNDRVR